MQVVQEREFYTPSKIFLWDSQKFTLHLVAKCQL